jgi:FG-GAP-like repeat/Cadherin domain/FG-GAP repeat
MARSLFSWLKNTRQVRNRGTRPGRSCLRVEGLEDRLAPALSFGPAVTLGAGDAPRSVAVGDVNGDGRSDLAIATYGTAAGGSVSVLLNTTAPGAATPSFAIQQSFNLLGRNPVSLVLRDLDGDSRLDLVTANDISNDVSVLLNTTAPGATTASFGGANSYAAGTFQSSVAVGDVNGDGHPDLIVARTSGKLSVLPGNGIGAFPTLTQFNIPANASSLVVLDVNGDGHRDLVVASPGFVTVLVGSGNGNFPTSAGFAAGASPSSVTVGDLNDDGRPDIVAANSSSNVSVLLNTTAPGGTTPSFAAQQTFAAGSNPSSVAVGDFNCDGKTDLAVANSLSANVSGLAGKGDGTFEAAANFAAQIGPSSVAVDDFNGDGTSDLVVANEASDNVTVLLANHAPTDMTLSNSSVAENQPDGTTVGTFSTTDPDGGDTFSYDLVNGYGDNGSFIIGADGELKTVGSFNYEAKSSYSIRVKSTDSGGVPVVKDFTVSVIDLNDEPTLTVPGAQTAYEDVDKAIGGISVGDVDSANASVTLSVNYGTLTVGPAGQTVSGSSVTLSGSINDLNAMLATLVYRGALNFSGADTLQVSVSDGSLSTSGSLAITVNSWAQQAADLNAQVDALVAAGVLNKGRGKALNLNLKDNNGDGGKVRAFLNQVRAFLQAGILTQAQADSLLVPGKILLRSVRTR